MFVFVLLAHIVLGVTFPFYPIAGQAQTSAQAVIPAPPQGLPAENAQPAEPRVVSAVPVAGPATLNAADDPLHHAIELQDEQTKLIGRQLESLKAQIERLRPNPLDKWLPAIFGLLGAAVGAVSAYAIQRQRLNFDQQAARRAAGIKETSEIKQFRGRQLNEFYGPLEALLKQGLVVRNELYVRLLDTADPDVVFSRINDERATAKWSLGIQRSGEEKAKPFRLLDELPLLQKRFPNLMGTVDETVRINRLVVKLVREKVGLVLHDNTELSQQLGTFLAHQTVLEDMYKVVKRGGTAEPPRYTTTFPRDLQRLVQDDCEKLRGELSAWHAEVTLWMNQLSSVKGPSK